ncbi:hypothetical protein PsorP6_012261 [Peronosclerospora sorghi]|uniref:Uncharacterized protein n=1 Tax=Peronosclerospora sorghi TaxID=230839 RepID=A0ACC0WKK0_9STRA|nr:hypothetical protein PsorP6_012261 [Peronosclerospora sorghi]
MRIILQTVYNTPIFALMAARRWERNEDLALRDDFGASKDVDHEEEIQNSRNDPEASVVTQKRRRNLLRESHLVSAEGFKKVYRTFPYQLNADVSGRETQALASLIKMYKQWAFELHPGLNFEDFVDRTLRLGKGHQVQALMAELREHERLKVMKKMQEEEKEDDREEDEASSPNEIEVMEQS